MNVYFILDIVYIFFFFFKQKTAYEMRISDWSSDVCSSDLGDYSNWMGQKVWLGGAMASALALQIGATPPPGWTSQHKLSGIAHALWAVRYDAKGDHFAAGVPEPQWIGKWVRVYD